MADSIYPPALKVDGLTKSFKRSGQENKALNNISFTVEQGDFFGLLGPNGAGKSTLIGILASTVKPDSGTAQVLGRSLETDMRAFKMAIGIVPQEITFDPHMTVWDTLRLQSGYYGLRNNKAWLEELLERIDLTDKKDTNVSRLSGGMKRRVLIAQALVHRPPVIVLDEPTAGVDVELRHRLWDFMEELNNKGHTIVLTTHYLEEAERLCKNIAMLNKGDLVALDSTQSLLQHFSKERIKFSLPTGQTLPPDFPFHCTPIGNGYYSLETQGAENLRTFLDAMHNAGLAPEGLELGNANLEEVFLRLTHGKL